MTFEIKQNNELITLSSFDEKYCSFTGEELRSDILRLRAFARFPWE